MDKLLSLRQQGLEVKLKLNCNRKMLSQGVLEEHETENPAMSLDCVVYGSVPPGAGMSSSSALVCAAALATATAHNLSISKARIGKLFKKVIIFLASLG